MGKAEKPVLVVGALNKETSEEVLRAWGPTLGDIAIGLTDGEWGPRRLWAAYVWHWIFEEHPQIEISRAPKGIEGMPDWVPAGYHDLMKFKVKDGLDEITIERLGYADYAKESYLIFRKLRDEGVISGNPRFQVCMPFPEDAVRLVTTETRDFEIIAAAYQDCVKREAAEISAAIPHEDLMFQWDINWEVIAVETDDGGGQEPLTCKVNGNPYDRYAAYLSNLGAAIPEEVPMGLHLCYGDLNHEHFLQPADLGVCVKMANLGVSAAGRPVNYVHMPVPLSRDDDGYFEPLKDLEIGDATLYVGLVHYTDGVEGALNRINTFKRHYSGSYGIATECGMGRRPEDQDLEKLLQIHRDVAEQMS
jgi:hypothetical protein